jgi:hypothetical protein
MLACIRYIAAYDSCSTLWCERLQFLFNLFQEVFGFTLNLLIRLELGLKVGKLFLFTSLSTLGPLSSQSRVKA